MKTVLIDLDWCVGKLKIWEKERNNSEWYVLEIISPAHADENILEPAQSVSIGGRKVLRLLAETILKEVPEGL